MRRKNGGDGGGWLISPDGAASVCLPLLSFLAQQSPEEDFFWHRFTRVVPEKGP